MELIQLSIADDVRFKLETSFPLIRVLLERLLNILNEFSFFIKVPGDQSFGVGYGGGGNNFTPKVSHNLRSTSGDVMLPILP